MAEHNMELEERLFKADRELELTEARIGDEVVIRKFQIDNSYSDSDVVDVRSTVEYGKRLESVVASLNDMDLGDSFNSSDSVDVELPRKTR